MGRKICNAAKIFLHVQEPGVNPALLLRTSITASGQAAEAEEWATPLSRWF
jgi:hypothetical protein